MKNRADVPDRVPPKPIGGGLMTVAALAAVAVMVVAPPVFVVVTVGMLPTVVALIVDPSPRKYAAKCVGGLNFSGVVPYLVLLWGTSNTFSGAVSVLSDVYAWLVMYSAAGLGWLLYLGLPPVVAGVLRIQAGQRIVALRAYQATLVKDWGKGVAEPGPRK